MQRFLDVMGPFDPDVRLVAVLAVRLTSDGSPARFDRVESLIDRVGENRIDWKVPAGRWQVVRFVCSNNGQQLIAASPNSKGPFIDFLDPAATPLDRFIADDGALKSSPSILIVGNEADGVDPTIQEIATDRVTIPMHLGTDSLNVAVAAAVFMYELISHRNR